MTTLEQVEKLRARANISYDEAKAALDAADGDLLQAIINLEKEGKINAPAGGGYYSSERTDASINGLPFQANYGGYQNHNRTGGENFVDLLKRFGRFCMRLLHKSTANSFEVLKGSESKATIPVLALVLLVVFAFWVTIPLAIIGLFFGFRYRFSGPDFRGNTVNNVMDSAADAAEDIKKSVDF